MPLPPVAERFLRYVQIDTQSDPDSDTTPSTEKQKDLSRLLVDELKALGVDDATMDDYGYVFGAIASTLPAQQAAQSPVVALLAHVDTAPDESGTGVKPVVHYNYDGGILKLPGDPTVTLGAITLGIFHEIRIVVFQSPVAEPHVRLLPADHAVG